MRPLRIAMWSGPRNISTAMMRSWGNRPDAIVIDEPFYAHYLMATGVDHPGRDDVIAAHECDWQKVAAQLTGPVPGGKTIYYQKHMAHHWMSYFDTSFLDQLTHAFLIREPGEMLTSLVRNVPHPKIESTGLPQQLELFRREQRRLGKAPPIVDARDVLENPRRMLGLLCEALDVPFRDEMLAWPAGRRETDGLWAPHWYAAVEKSTGFDSYRPKNEPVPTDLRGLLEECEGVYNAFHAQRLR